MGKCPGRTRQIINLAKILFIHFILHSHSIIFTRMFVTDTPIVFVADAPTIFVLVFATLLFISWITLILWVHLVIARDSNPNEPDNIELAIQGRSPPQPPLNPSSTTFSSLLS
jgi:hypothetical protein